MPAFDTMSGEGGDVVSATSSIKGQVATLALDDERKRNKEAKKEKKMAAREKNLKAASSASSSNASTSNPASSMPRSARTGRSNDTPQVQLSKALSYILRHGAAKEGLPMRPDGFIGVERILARPKVARIAMPDPASPQETHGPTIEDIRAVVSNDAKGRYELKEDNGELVIRAVQGHSLSEVTALDHTALTLDNLSGALGGDDAVGKAAVEVLHGTTWEAWEKIEASGGLSRMARNHIHLAKGRTGASGVISGMRASSPLILHIDIVAALGDGISFFTASNGAILTRGREDKGILDLRYIERVEETKTGRTVWERSSADNESA